MGMCVTEPESGRGEGNAMRQRPGVCTAMVACTFSLTWIEVLTETFPSIEGGSTVSRTDFFWAWKNIVALGPPT